MTETVTGVSVPDSPLASEATALLREAGTPLLLSDGLSCGSRGGRNHQTSIGTGEFLGYEGSYPAGGRPSQPARPIDRLRSRATVF